MKKQPIIVRITQDTWVMIKRRFSNDFERLKKEKQPLTQTKAIHRQFDN